MTNSIEITIPKKGTLATLKALDAILEQGGTLSIDSAAGPLYFNDQKLIGYSFKQRQRLELIFKSSIK